MKKPRIAISPEEKGRRAIAAKVIGSESLAESGKKNPASISSSGIKELTEKEEEETEKEEIDVVSKSIYVPLIKSNDEERTITGVVLQPEVVDAQGDIISKEVIRKAAHKFLSKYNKATKLGLMHQYFGNLGFELYESWLAPQSVVINGTTIKEGSWIMTVYVGSNKIWKLIKAGKLRGYSIGGKAKARKIKETELT